MRIRWERITGIVCLGICTYLMVKLHPLLLDIFKIANEPFNYDSPIKAIMIAGLCLTFLIGIKLILTKK